MHLVHSDVHVVDSAPGGGGMRGGGVEDETHNMPQHITYVTSHTLQLLQLLQTAPTCPVQLAPCSPSPPCDKEEGKSAHVGLKKSM